MAHKDIRIPFEIKGRRFEAVGFLEKDESYVSGEEMLSRTAGENGGVIGDDDEAFLFEHRRLFRKKLRPYRLVTNERSFLSQGVFFWIVWRWYRDSGWIGFGWGDFCLVVRRCA